jgi:ribose transport system permease protein
MEKGNRTHAQGPAEYVRRVYLTLGMLPFVLVALIIIMGILNPRFLTMSNGIIVARQACFLALVACGQMLVILTRGVDVSLGAQIGLCSVVAALVSKELGAVAGWFTPILVGGAVGLLNGAVVAYARIDSFAVTLGTLSISHGLALIISKGLTIYYLPPAYKTIAYARVFTIPLPVVITFLVIIAIYFILYRLQFGRYVYAAGDNIEALRRSGVNTSRVLLWVFCGAGILTGISATLLSSRINSGQPNLGGTLMLESIAACVIGGVTFQGGVGTLLGVVFGILFLSAMSNGFDLIGVSAFVKQVVVGSIIIVAVVADKYKERG